MNILRFKIPLLLISNTEPDPECKYTALTRKLENLDIAKVEGINTLDGQYCWIHDYRKWYSDENYVNKMLKSYKDANGFNIDEVIMEVTMSDEGFYIAEIITNEPLDKIVFVNKWKSNMTMTLRDAIISFLNGCLYDGIGENPIGTVKYNHTTHSVWLGKLEEIL